MWGFTLDAFDDTALASVAGIVGGDRAEGAVRIVFDAEERPSHYRSAVAAAHRAGIAVVGQILYSAEMASMTVAQWRSRVAAYVTELPDVDTWEVGNEVNGGWLAAFAGAGCPGSA